MPQGPVRTTPIVLSAPVFNLGLAVRQAQEPMRDQARGLEPALLHERLPVVLLAP